jgi:hypothetical protein
MLLKVGPHHMYIQAKRDPNQQWLLSNYRLEEHDVILVVNEWEKSGKPQCQKKCRRRCKTKIKINKNYMNMKNKGMVRETPHSGEKRKEHPKE